MLELVPWEDDQTWDQSVSHSPQGSVFLASHFLKILGVAVTRYQMMWKGRAVGGVPLFFDSATRAPLPAPLHFTMYQGPWFTEEFHAQPSHRRIPQQLQVMDALLGELCTRYPLVSFCLHPSFDDLRPFSWHNYHEPARGMFDIQLRYTGVLDLRGCADHESVIAGARTVRRYEYRQCEKQEIRAVAGSAADETAFMELYCLTFERQGLTVAADERALLQRGLHSALANHCGELRFAVLPNGDRIAATIFLRDTHTSYYWMSATHPEFRNTGANALLMFDNIERARNAGLRAVDLVGVNSPNRGDFKISFGAALRPYHVVTWRSPSS